MPKQPTNVYMDMLPLDSVALDRDAFDNALRQHGVKFRHWRAMKCPVGMTEVDDHHRTHGHHEHCSNGFIYVPAGTVTVLFTGNGNDPRFIDVGLIDGSSSQVTLPRFYDDPENKPVHVHYADRFYLVADDAELEVAHWNVLRHHETGTDRLDFPATRVEHVIDSHGRRYDPSLFAAVNGNLKWLTNDQPAAGEVCTAWYVYQPFWYCSRVLHEVRVSQTIDYLTGQASVKRFPYSIIIQRENVFKNEEIDPSSPTPRNQTEGESGGFGPR